MLGEACCADHSRAIVPMTCKRNAVSFHAWTCKGGAAGAKAAALNLTRSSRTCLMLKKTCIKSSESTRSSRNSAHLKASCATTWKTSIGEKRTITTVSSQSRMRATLIMALKAPTSGAPTSRVDKPCQPESSTPRQRFRKTMMIDSSLDKTCPPLLTTLSWPTTTVFTLAINVRNRSLKVCYVTALFVC